MAVLLTALCHPVPAVLAGQFSSAAPAQGQPTPFEDPEAQGDRVAPVLVGGEPTIWVTAGVGPYTPQFRADRIGQRLHEAIRDRSIRDPTVTVTESEGSSELRAGSRLLMVVTQSDARSLGASRPVVAEQYARELESAIRAERLRYAPGDAHSRRRLRASRHAGAGWRRVADSAPRAGDSQRRRGAGGRDVRGRCVCSRRKSSPLTGSVSPSSAPSASAISCWSCWPSICS